MGLADAILLDLALPEMSGLEVLRELRKINRDVPVILVTGSATSDAAVEAARYGVQACLTKPLKSDEVTLTVQLAVAGRRFRSAASAPRAALEGGPSVRDVLGHSPAIQRVIGQIELIAPTDFTVVLTGETGVGKEVAAQSIHRLSPRAGGPFVPVDCGSIPATLIESELFGHEKGAFTGADRMRIGSFEAAAAGTLFLDEIGNLPLAMQAKLLRTLQERRIYRIGSTTPIPLSARILVATNEDLVAMIAGGTFRRDLYYRLNEFNILLPPLRERGEDVLFLARRFIARANDELHKHVGDISAAAAELLRGAAWPGNVRELRNLMRRAVLLADAQIRPEHLSVLGRVPCAASRPASPPADTAGAVSFRDAVRQQTRDAEREVLARALRQTHGNMKEASRLLRIDYKTMRTKVKQYQLSPRGEKGE